jgi:hypothetical protein
LRGPIPLNFADAGDLRELDYSETAICVPQDAALLAWLDGLEKHTGTGIICEEQTLRLWLPQVIGAE